MTRHIHTVDQVLRLEIGYNNSMAPASLMDAITEAMERANILTLAGVIYVRGETPAENLVAVDLWAPDVEPTTEVPPTPDPEKDSTIEP